MTISTLMTWGAISWFLFSPTVHAQSNWSAVVNLSQDRPVRVEATNNRQVIGRLHRVDETELAIVNGLGDIARFRREDVRVVDQLIGDLDSKKRGARKGFLWGALLSALGTYGTLANGGAKELSIVYGTFMGGGAAIGALLAESPEWRVVYKS